MGSYGLKQVIFLIDTTASVAPYWADLKKYYIFPIINFFNNSEVPTKGMLSILYGPYNMVHIVLCKDNKVFIKVKWVERYIH